MLLEQFEVVDVARKAVPDSFLRWSRGPDGNDCYVRQLWDMQTLAAAVQAGKLHAVNDL